MSPVGGPTPEVVEAFHRAYWEAEVIHRTTFLGFKCCQAVGDLWMFQEILTEQRPDWVIEFGTAWGGTALFLATVQQALGGGRVLTVDKLAPEGRPAHPCLEYLQGDCLAPDTAARVRAHTGGGRALVILDAAHQYETMLRQMELYAPMVSAGSYLVVCDTNLNGHPIEPGWGDGPWEAVADFLPRHPEFEIDRGREKFLMTMHASGYLRRKEN